MSRTLSTGWYTTPTGQTVVTSIREGKGSEGDPFPSDWWRGKCTIVETVIMDFECVEGLKTVARGFHPSGERLDGRKDDHAIDVILTEMHVSGARAVYECIKAKMVSDLVPVKANPEDDGAG